MSCWTQTIISFTLSSVKQIFMNTSYIYNTAMDGWYICMYFCMFCGRGWKGHKKPTEDHKHIQIWFARCILWVFEWCLETAAWHFVPSCWTKTKPHLSPNNNIWACLTARINKQALWTLNRLHSITLTPSPPVPLAILQGVGWWYGTDISALIVCIQLITKRYLISNSWQT